VSLHETEIGNLPEPWQITQLGEESSIGNGSTPKRTNARYWDGGTIPWLTSAKVYDGVIRAADEFVTEGARHECHLPLVPKGSLVVAITGQGKTLGNSAILAIDACVSQHLAYVTFNTDRLIPEYALAYLRSRYGELQSVSRSGGSTKGALTCGYLRGFCLPVPSSTEQCRIVDCLSALDTKQMAEEGRKCVLDSLFRSLLNGLMTAQIRLPGFASGKVR
jgi:type I restriction enzyme S subunit